MDEQLNKQAVEATPATEQASATPAEAQNTETTSASEPGPVPYSRFRTLNEEHKNLKQQVEQLLKAQKSLERANMSEVERLKADKAELEERVNKAAEAVREMRISAAFRQAVAGSKVKFIASAIEDAFRLADLTGVQIDEESGAVKGMEDVIEKLAKDKPYLVQRPEPVQIDANAGTGSGKSPSENPKAKELELRQRFRIP